MIVNSVDAERKSPLQCAIESDSIETAKVLRIITAVRDLHTLITSIVDPPRSRRSYGWGGLAKGRN